MKNLLAAFAAMLLLASCAALPPRAHSDRFGHSTNTGQWLRTELYFGIGAANAYTDMADNERRWREFLDREITPRFPDGLTVYDVYGQWRAQERAEIQHERSKEVMLIYRDTAQHRADIEAIRAAWRKLTGDESVLRVTQPAEVAF